jgi:hypothetical protein
VPVPWQTIRTVLEFRERTMRRAADYFVRLQCMEGVPPPEMSGGGSLDHGAGLASLLGRGRQTSVRAGTLFRRRICFASWFEAL